VNLSQSGALRESFVVDGYAVGESEAIEAHEAAGSGGRRGSLAPHRVGGSQFGGESRLLPASGRPPGGCFRYPLGNVALEPSERSRRTGPGPG